VAAVDWAEAVGVSLFQPARKAADFAPPSRQRRARLAAPISPLSNHKEMDQIEGPDTLIPTTGRSRVASWITPSSQRWLRPTC
jgi:hypothetical protein